MSGTDANGPMPDDAGSEAAGGDVIPFPGRLCPVAEASAPEAEDAAARLDRALLALTPLGQFERDLIQERTRAGLAAAARGRKGGRKPVITDDKLKRAHRMVGKGLTVRKIAMRLKVGKTALYEALKTGQV